MSLSYLNQGYSGEHFALDRFDCLSYVGSDEDKVLEEQEESLALSFCQPGCATDTEGCVCCSLKVGHDACEHHRGHSLLHVVYLL